MNCPRCGYSKDKASLEKHFARKTKCKAVVSDIELTQEVIEKILNGPTEIPVEAPVETPKEIHIEAPIEALVEAPKESLIDEKINKIELFLEKFELLLIDVNERIKKLEEIKKPIEQPPVIQDQTRKKIVRYATVPSKEKEEIQKILDTVSIPRKLYRFAE